MTSGVKGRRSGNELVEIAAELQHETGDAFKIFDGVTDAWLPKSLVEQNDDGTFTMPLWIAKDKGFM